ncbi:TetR/AcrR family transcriptional regulator [Microbacterium sp. SSM24]|uniref:TetR/AcrR family transcriptional regulator n=1 Tax=Microbacterium sp. SSM24 TaxID=2991714 RepID=UPI00222734C6|nr:TetR/AcrR family transcriptional regulator [Microbacterium sp. SSM24]MCW3492439.1 TetR/AcrR family transcriptional regulator [Microbacterium sp. SSM24]
MANTQTGRTKPTRKPRLDRDTIVAAALELASAPGVASVSFRDLGARLGVDPTAVYRHFRSKDELMGALFDHLTELGLQEIVAPPEQWQDRLRQLALGSREWLSRYPAVGAEAMLLTTNGPSEHRAMEIILDAFTRAGLKGDDLVRHYALFAMQALSGSANAARARAQRPGESDTLWLDAPLLVDPHEFPLIAENGGRLAEIRDQSLYLAAVDMVIASAERTAAAS